MGRGRRITGSGVNEKLSGDQAEPMKNQGDGRDAARATDASPLVSVIVPVYEDESRLKLCLRALAAQTGVPSYEVIVVDNGSAQPPVAALPDSARFRLVHEAQPGSYAARNRGLSVARGELIAFTDADCVPEQDWLEKGVARLLEDAEVGLVAGRIDVYALDPGARTLAERYHEIAGFPQRRYVAERHFGATANVFTRRSVVDAVGEFSARLKSGGDMEWGQRVHGAGFRVVYAKEVVVRHPARRRLRELLKQAVRVAGGRREMQKGSTEEAFRNAARPLGSPLSSFMRLWSDPRLPTLKARLGVVGVGFVLRAAYAYESFRLAFGGRTRR